MFCSLPWLQTYVITLAQMPEVSDQQLILHDQTCARVMCIYMTSKQRSKLLLLSFQVLRGQVAVTKSLPLRALT